MKIKKKLSKKILIPTISSLILGLSLGTTSAYSEGDLKKAELKNSEIVTEIAFANSELESKKTELSNLELKANDLEQQKEIIDTKIAEAQAKAQAEAEAQAKAQAEAEAQAKAQAEAEAQAKAQAEAEAQAKAQAEAEAQAKAQAQNNQSSPNKNNTGGSNGSGGGGSSGIQANESRVWKTATGKKYHRTNNCGNTNSSNAILITLQEAKNLGLTPCQKCY